MKEKKTVEEKIELSMIKDHDNEPSLKSRIQYCKNEIEAVHSQQENNQTFTLNNDYELQMSKEKKY